MQTPISPSSASLPYSSRGKWWSRSHSAAYGSISAFANSRVSAWISRWSAVSSKSTNRDVTRELGGCQFPFDLAQLGLGVEERLDDVRIELPARLVEDLLASGVPAERPPVRAVARHRVERVGDREDPRSDRDLGLREPVR